MNTIMPQPVSAALRLDAQPLNLQLVVKATLTLYQAETKSCGIVSLKKKKKNNYFLCVCAHLLRKVGAQSALQ